MRHSDGTDHTCAALAVPVQDAEGVVIGGVVVFPDVTERRQLEERLRSVVNNVNDMIYRMSLPDGRYEYVSPASVAIFGYSPEEFYESPLLIRRLIHPDWQEYFKTEWDRLLCGEQPPNYEYQVIDRSGSTRWLSQRSVLIRNSKGQPVAIEGVVTDCTTRKEAELQVLELERRNRALLDYSPVSHKVVDLDLNLQYMNANGFRMLNLPQTAAVYGKPYPFDFFPEASRNRITDELRRTIETEKMVAFEDAACDSNGNEIWLFHNLIPVHNNEGALDYITVVSADITEGIRDRERARQLADKLSRAKRMEALGVLAGGVAHDLNNTLGPLVVLPELLAEDLADPANLDIGAALESLEIIKGSALRSTAIVQDLVSLGRRGHYDFVRLDLARLECLLPDSKVIEQLKGIQRSLNFSVQPSEDTLIVLADETHISRVFDNLIRNAAEAIQDEGQVTIKTGKTHLKAPQDGYEIIPKGDYATIEISDTGDGIEPAHLDRIFEPFYTEKKTSRRSGSGLGLSVVSRIVKDHRGFIDVSSEPCKGSTFTVYLPIAVGQISESDRPLPVCGGTERILVVDDEPGQRFLCQRSLGVLGYEVDVANDGHQAVAIFQHARNADQSSPYDLVIMDMIMEPDFDGLDAYKAIFDLYPDQKVILASGHAENDRAIEAVKMGAIWLAKPYVRDTLVQIVRRRQDTYEVR